MDTNGVEQRADRCEVCRFWQKNFDVVTVLGDCRRNAPVVGHDGDVGMAVTLFPTMPSDGWCGQFEPTPGEQSRRQLLGQPIRILDLGMMLHTDLLRVGVNKIKDLVSLSANDLHKMLPHGRDIIRWIEPKLAAHGLSLANPAKK